MFQHRSISHRHRHGLRAAALWESFLQNHPFIDGNKRAAATYTFLKINGYEASTEAWTAAVGFLSALYEANEFRFEKLEPWLRENAKPMR